MPVLSRLKSAQQQLLTLLVFDLWMIYRVALLDGRGYYTNILCIKVGEHKNISYKYMECTWWGRLEKKNWSLPGKIFIIEHEADVDIDMFSVRSGQFEIVN